MPRGGPYTTPDEKIRLSLKGTQNGIVLKQILLARPQKIVGQKRALSATETTKRVKTRVLTTRRQIKGMPVAEE